MGAPCVATSPAFHPKFEALSNEDLDVCEILALLLIAGAPIDPTLPVNTGLNRLLLSFLKWSTECFQHMSARQKREYEAWWVLYLQAGCVTDEQMRRTIRQFNALVNTDERQAMLTGLRALTWDYATCGDLP